MSSLSVISIDKTEAKQLSIDKIINSFSVDYKKNGLYENCI